VRGGVGCARSCRLLAAVLREATTMMLTTKDSQLGNTHTVYGGLQDELRRALQELPGDYHHIIDDSPFYLWCAMLDPRVMAGVLEQDALDDFEYLDQTKKSKAKVAFAKHYVEKYTPNHVPPVRTALPPRGLS